MADVCLQCGKGVTPDEIGLTKKLINRGTTQWLCYGCMAKHFEVPVELLHRKVEEFRAMGCTLFEPHT